jgi:hypothetical protein
VRAGEPLEAVDIGLALENFDLVRTGADGMAELALGGAGVPAMSIQIAPRSQFAVEIARLGSRQQTAVSLIAGTIAVKCAKLTAGHEVKVRTESTVMGVRGTRFTVTAAASGDVLVTCDEGEIACTDEDGSLTTAAPGTAVEKRAGVRLRAIAVAVASLEGYRREWLAGRIAALKADALATTIPLAKLHIALSRQFADDFTILMQAQKTIDKWADEDRKGRTGGIFELARERREVIGALLRLRRTLARLERVHARLLEMKEYHDEGYGRGEIEPGLSADQFFQRLSGERRDLEQKMARVRYVAKLYALRSGGRVPTGAFDETEKESSFR